MSISPAVQQDLLLYFFFLLGQLAFILKRAGSAIRNPKAAIVSRKQFLKANWDTIIVRGLIEVLVIFYPVRHFTLAQLFSFFGWSGAWNVQILSAVVASPFAFAALGYAADSVLDWLAISQKLPAFLRVWLAENVPQIGGPND